MKRILALALIVLSLVCIAGVAFADENDNSRASNYFDNYGISIAPIGSGKVTFTMSCSSAGTASQLGVSSYTVYRYDNGSWTYIASGTGTYKYNVSSYALSKTFNGVAGEKYRVKCTFVCTKNGTSENKSSTSPSVTAN